MEWWRAVLPLQGLAGADEKLVIAYQNRQTIVDLPIARLVEIGQELIDLIHQVEPDAIAVTVRGPARRVADADLSGLALRVSDEDLLDLEPGASRRVPVLIDGVADPYLRILPAFDSVTVRRPPGDPAPEGPDSVATPGGGGS